jgi:hypothetical protein
MEQREQDPRRAFLVGTIAGAIAPPGQKVGSGVPAAGSAAGPRPPACRPGQTAHAALQEAYAQFIAKDDTGAIAAFLEDASTNILQVRPALAAARAASRPLHAPARPSDCRLAAAAHLARHRPAAAAASHWPGQA